MTTAADRHGPAVEDSLKHLLTGIMVHDGCAQNSFTLEPPIMNYLYFGDNLDVLRQHINDERESLADR
jgi:hypothetical protein